MGDEENIEDILDVITFNYENINKFASFNINKRIHPSYVQKIVTEIPLLKSINLSTNNKPFPVSIPKNLKKEVLLPQPNILKKEIILQQPNILKKEIILPQPNILKKEIILPVVPKKEIILPIVPKKEIILPIVPKKEIILPISPKKEIIFPSSTKKNIILPSSPKKEIILPISPKSKILIPNNMILPINQTKIIISSKKSIDEEILSYGLKIINVTNLRPNIPKINELYIKPIKNVVKFDTVELPELTTILKFEKSRPIVFYKEDTNIPKIADIDDEHRRILLNIDFNKLSYSRHGPNNEVYDLPYVKDLAKKLKISLKGNKDKIIDRIIEKAISLGIDTNKK